MSTNLYIILPCQNEEAALEICLADIKDILHRNNLTAEIIVSDSSTDASPHIAKSHNTTLICHQKNGYGNAYHEAFKRISTGYVFCADPDCSYDFSEIPRFIHALDSGAQLVIGDRYSGTVDQGAMPWLHRYIGGPILSGLVKYFFGGTVRDINCGMRAFHTDILSQIKLEATGMEFASEMIIQSLLHNVTIDQLPIDYHRRMGDSKLRTFRDGYRHLALIVSTFFNSKDAV